jgi:type VI secretion system protein ImpH
MAAALRLEEPLMIEDLVNEPWAFEFFQAVRVLMAHSPQRTAIGEFGDPTQEAVRFSANPEVGFPAGEIQAFDPVAKPPKLTVNFMGLTGPLGVMPLMYAELVAERARSRDTALRDFLDIFNHRMISLFYKAWEKNRFTIAYEQGRSDGLTRHLLDVLGLGTEGLRGRLPLNDETLLYYAGALAPHTRPAAALEGLIADHFGVPVEVEQFVGGWYRLEETAYCVLGDEDEAGTLGAAVVGDEVWDAQARVRLRIGPLTRRQYDDLLPTGSGWHTLLALAKFFVGDQLDVDVRLVLARDEVQPCALGQAEDTALPLGWTTWLGTAPLTRDPDDTLLTLSEAQEAA